MLCERYVNRKRAFHVSKIVENSASYHLLPYSITTKLGDTRGHGSVWYFVIRKFYEAADSALSQGAFYATIERHQMWHTN